MMIFYKKYSTLIEEKLNDDGKGLFSVKYLENNEAYNYANLVKDDMCVGVVRLVSSNINNLSDIGAENRIDILQVEFLIPLKHPDTSYFVNRIFNNLDKFNNHMEKMESSDVFTTNVQLIQDRMLDEHFNGELYESIIYQMQLNISVDFLYSNEGILTINGDVVDCKASITLNSAKIAEGNIYQASYNQGVQQPRFNGLQYSFDCTLTYNKNSNIHKTLLKHWMCGGTWDIGYTLDELNFTRTCQMTIYTLNAITGDTIKLRVVFTEAGADFSG